MCIRDRSKLVAKEMLYCDAQIRIQRPHKQPFDGLSIKQPNIVYRSKVHRVNQLMRRPPAVLSLVNRPSPSYTGVIITVIIIIILLLQCGLCRLYLPASADASPILQNNNNNNNNNHICIAPLGREFRGAGMYYCSSPYGQGSGIIPEFF